MGKCKSCHPFLLLVSVYTTGSSRSCRLLALSAMQSLRPSALLIVILDIVWLTFCGYFRHLLLGGSTTHCFVSFEGDPSAGFLMCSFESQKNGRETIEIPALIIHFQTKQGIICHRTKAQGTLKGLFSQLTQKVMQPSVSCQCSLAPTMRYASK